MPKVLISDKMSPQAEAVFQEHGIEVDVKTGLSPEELQEIIGDYDGLAIRSATKATKEIIESASNLKVIGRAGIGVDNVDIPTASQQGVIVMNTPFGNTVTTAEHALSLMVSAARNVPQASAALKAGRWEKSKWGGVELYQKTLGVIGTGNIGSLVIERAHGLKMRVIAYDPFISKERADDLGV
ncbi:MAG: NAD(P)-dependent oxidoreductase, partial [Thiohalorhabdaceae bacterium]